MGRLSFDRTISEEGHMRKQWIMLASAMCVPVITAGPTIGPVSAQSPSPSSTMASLARSVVDDNPDVETQRVQIRIAQARLEGAEAGYMPTIEANGSVQRREINVRGGTRNDSKYTSGHAAIEARLRFFDGNRTYNSVEIAKAELLSTEATLDGAISDTLLELLTSSADVLLNRKILSFSQMQSDAIAEQLRATSRKLEFSEATRTDEELARARLATSQANVLAATEELNVQGFRFRTVSGQSGTIVPPLPVLAELPSSLPAAQKIAAEMSPRLRAARLNAIAGKAGAAFALGALLPQLDAVGGYEYLTGGVANLFTGKLPEDRSSVYGGLELRVPVFLPKDHAEVRRARAVRDQRLAQIETAERTVAEDVSSSWTRWQSAKSTIVSAEAAVAATEQAVAGLKKEAVGGNRTLTEVLDAQNSLLASQVSLERAKRNEFVARALVLAAIGRLNVDAIEEGRCCAAGGTPRPAASPLGRPAIADVSKLPVEMAPVAPRPAGASLGRGSEVAAGPPQAAQEESSAIPNPSRPSASRLGRKPN